MSQGCGNKRVLHSLLIGCRQETNWRGVTEAGCVWMWELDYKESWAPKSWCFWAVVLEKTLESPLDCKEIQPVHPKGDKSWMFIGRIDVEAATPILWPIHAKSWLIGKDSDAGRDWGQEEEGMTEDEMVGWGHWLNGHEFEQALGDGDGLGSLACCSLWGHNESDTTELLNNKNTIELFQFHSKTEECFWKELWDCTKLTEVPSNQIEPILASWYF